VVKKLIKDLGNTPVAKITPKFLSDYRNKRLDIDGKAPQTVKHELGVIIRSLRLAREYGYEVGLVQMPKIKVKNQEVKVFTKGQLESIFDVLYQNDLYLFHVYRFLLETCMRRGELYRISLNNISFLTDTRYRGEGEGSTLLLKDTKNSEDRRIPLTSYARESLNYLLEHQTEKDLPFHIANNLKINYSPRYITEYFVHICRYGVGLEGVKLHWLRHQGITLLFEKGFNIMEVSSISGHKDLTSLKRYTHIDVEVLIPRLGESILKSC
jgi:integrase